MNPSAPSPFATTADEQFIWSLLASVPDPEIPVLNVVELGTVRYVRAVVGRAVTVGVSPTYSGCPATEVIQNSIKAKLASAGIADVTIETVLSPPWTTDWLTDGAREKLRRYGIAPPRRSVTNPGGLLHRPNVQCPQCSSLQTERVSEFASTACKALYRCTACLEPFEYFKCL